MVQVPVHLGHRVVHLRIPHLEIRVHHLLIVQVLLQAEDPVDLQVHLPLVDLLAVPARRLLAIQVLHRVPDLVRCQVAAPVHIRALHQAEHPPAAQVHLLRVVLQAAQVGALVHPQAHLLLVDPLAVLLIDQVDLPRLHPAELRREVQVNLRVQVSTLVVPHLRALQ